MVFFIGLKAFVTVIFTITLLAYNLNQNLRCARNCGVSVYTNVKRTVFRKRYSKIQNAAVVEGCYLIFQN